MVRRNRHTSKDLDLPNCLCSCLSLGRWGPLASLSVHVRQSHDATAMIAPRVPYTSWALSYLPAEFVLSLIPASRCYLKRSSKGIEQQYGICWIALNRVFRVIRPNKSSFSRTSGYVHCGTYVAPSIFLSRAPASRSSILRLRSSIFFSSLSLQFFASRRQQNDGQQISIRCQ